MPENMRHAAVGHWNIGAKAPPEDEPQLYVAALWHKTVQAERAGCVADVIEKAHKIVADHRTDVLIPHSKREPRLFGKGAWQDEHAELVRVDRVNVDWYERVKGEQLTPGENAGLDQEADLRAGEKSP